MHILNEHSPNTLSGSFSRDLIASKIWLCDQLNRCGPARSVVTNGTVLVLGSWYGNLGLVMLSVMPYFRQVVLVDNDPRCIRFSKWLYGKLDPRLESRLQDANDLDYQQWRQPLLIVNTSCNDMEDHGWFRNIPRGSVVALQSRSDHEDMREFAARYPLGSTFYEGSIDLKDPETRYTRLLRIGLA